MTNSYENWNILCAIGALLSLAILVYAVAIDAYIVPLLVYATIVLILFFFADRAERKRFPQWRTLKWKTPWAAYIVLLMLFVALHFAMPNGTAKVATILCVFCMICLVGPMQKAYYAKKFHMDRYESVEALVEAHPEAQGKLK